MEKKLDTNLRKTVALPESMWRDIAWFQGRERIATEVEALRRLVQIALRSERRKAHDDAK